MKTIKITSTFTIDVPDSFKIIQLHEEVDGELIPTMPALKVGKKLAVPDMTFFHWEKNIDGTLEGRQDDELTDNLWNRFPSINHKIEII